MLRRFIRGTDWLSGGGLGMVFSLCLLFTIFSIQFFWLISRVALSFIFVLVLLV